MADKALIEQIENQTLRAKWFYDHFKDALLEIDDSFQRRFVWIEKHQIKLIETMLIGYPIPEVYLWDKSTDPNSGDTIYSIVDGQQRLSTIKQFIDGEFKLKSASLEYSDSAYANKLFDDLSKKNKSKIWKFPFSVRLIRSDVQFDEIKQMFLRLNETSMTLNPQELRNAEFDGEFLDLSEKMADHEFWNKYSVFNKYSSRRMLDVQFMSSILLFFRMGIEGETTQTGINKTYDLYNDEYEEKEDDKKLFNQLIEYADEMVQDHEASESFIKRKTHLYSLFTVLYAIHEGFGKLKDQHIKRFQKFTEAYENEELIDKNYDVDEKSLIYEYKDLVKEGTKSKSKRQRRFEILKSLIIE